MRVKLPIILISLVHMLVSGQEGTRAAGNLLPDENTYQNPVSDLSLPDPTVIRAEDGTFYLFATENIRNTPILISTDLVTWRMIGTAFSDQTRPTIEPDGGIWAPDINYIDGQYVLYYSMSKWGHEWTCGIGVATSSNPGGPYTDRGKLFRSDEIDVQNSIDPFFIEDGGKNYLFWGSFRGIYSIELSADGLSVRRDAAKRQVAGTGYEGAYLLIHNGFYYLFCSIGSCCEGVNSTYRTVVGRSDKLFGPYLNKSGGSMNDFRHEIVLHGNKHFTGPGHNAEIVFDNQGKTWMLYHAVDVENPHGRVLMLDELQWKDGWPYVEGNTPSTGSGRPSF